MEVHGFTQSGSIEITIDGVRMTVPDDMANRHRQMVAEWEEAGNVIPPYTPPSPSSEDVTAERDRRIAAGFMFNGVFFDFDARAKANIAGAAQLAFMAVTAGAEPGDLFWNGGETEFTWIAADNSSVPMDAHTVIAFGRAAAHHEQAHTMIARAIKDMAPIPGDYADDAYWSIPPVPDAVPAVPSPTIYGMASLTIEDGSITSILPVAGFGGAFAVDVGVYWVFFEKTQPDTDYLALCYNHDHDVFVSEKYEDYFVITSKLGGVPSDPQNIVVEIKRVS